METSVRDWAELVGLLIGAGTVLMALWKYVVAPIYRWGRRVADVHAKVQKIWTELQPNGGSTIRDQLSRLTEVCSRIETRQLVSEQVDKQVFASLPLGVFWTDERGRYTEVNRNFCRITGRTQEEVVGSNWSNHIHSDDREDVYEEWKACVVEARQFERTFAYVRPDGLLQKVRGMAVTLLSRDGKSIGWFGTIEKLGDPEREKPI